MNYYSYLFLIIFVQYALYCIPSLCDADNSHDTQKTENDLSCKLLFLYPVYAIHGYMTYSFK